MPPPPPEVVARQLLGAMNATHPPDPLGWVTLKDGQGKPLYLLVGVQGEQNIERFEQALEQLRGRMRPVEE